MNLNEILILPQIIKVKWNSSNKIHFESKGYKFTKFHDEFGVNVLDLSRGSKIKVKCNCNFCKQEFITSFKKINDIEYIPSCQNCIYIKIKQNNLKRYNVENVMHLKNTKEKIKKTNLKKYGVEYITQNNNIREKIKQTNLERYGVECSLQSEQAKEKSKQTNLAKYGYEHHMKNDKEKNKLINIMLNMYGVENISQLEEIKLKKEQTCLKNHGVRNGFQTEKNKQSIFNKYGVDNVYKNRKIINENIIKRNNTMYKNGTAPCSKQQKYLYKLLGGELNFPVSQCLLDIAFPEENIYIEYDGGGHDLRVKKGQISNKDFKIYELKRKKFLENQGWKLIRIISKNDILYNDNKLIELINEAKNYLKNTNHTWVEININNNEYQCVEYKKNIFFNEAMAIADAENIKKGKMVSNEAEEESEANWDEI